MLLDATSTVVAAATDSPATRPGVAAQNTLAAVATGIPAGQQPAQETAQAVRAAVQQIDAYLKSMGRAVEFRIDEDSGSVVVTVRDTASGDVIRQIPNEEALQLARHLQRGSGSLVDLIA